MKEAVIEAMGSITSANKINEDLDLPSLIEAEGDTTTVAAAGDSRLSLTLKADPCPLEQAAIVVNLSKVIRRQLRMQATVAMVEGTADMDKAARPPSPPMAVQQAAINRHRLLNLKERIDLYHQV